MHDELGRARTTCRHGYDYGDCPARCAACGHRCELHPESRCDAVECPCDAWASSDDDDDDAAGGAV
jgi:hypothetical protein